MANGQPSQPAALTASSPAPTGRRRWPRDLRAALALGVLATAVGGCGHSGHNHRRPPGPNVIGLSLRTAERDLDAHHLGFVEHLESGPLAIGKHGGTIRRGWLVCGEGYVNPTMVQLDATKHGSC
jgi:hypothetical protein